MKRGKLTPDELQAIRDLADRNAGPDDELDFYKAARQLGWSAHDAAEADETLTIRVMRARCGL